LVGAAAGWFADGQDSKDTALSAIGGAVICDTIYALMSDATKPVAAKGNVRENIFNTR